MVDPEFSISWVSPPRNAWGEYDPPWSYPRADIDAFSCLLKVIAVNDGRRGSPASGRPHMLGHTMWAGRRPLATIEFPIRNHDLFKIHPFRIFP